METTNKYVLIITIFSHLYLEATSTYICYSETIRTRYFTFTPGDYDPERMTPNYCRERCGVFGYAYTAVAEGKYCYCSSTLPSGSEASQLCNSTCSGSATETCGSRYHVGIYTSLIPLQGLKVKSDVVGIQETPATVKLDISVESGERLIFKTNFNDDSQYTTYNETGFTTRVIYLPGTYNVQVAATDETETLQAAYAVTGLTLHQPAGNVEITCDEYFATHEEGKCEIVIWTGNDLTVEVNVTGRSTFDMYLNDVADPTVAFVGSWLPVGLSTPNNVLFLIKSALFPSVGKVYGWRMMMKTAGMITIMILAPDCGSKKYCYETNSCEISCLTNTKSMSTRCSSSNAYCGQNNRCSSACSAPATRFPVGLPVDGYIVKWSADVTASVGDYWYNVESAFPEVQPGFVIALSQGVTGKVAEIAGDVSDFVVSSPPNGIITSSSGTDCNCSHAIQAYYSTGSKIPLKFTFLNSPGVFPLNVTVKNKKISHAANATTDIILLEGVDMAIIIGPEYLATNEASNFTLAPHTGTNLTYHWNISGVTDIFDGNLSVVIPTPGIYELTIAIFNAISKKVNSTVIYAQDKLTGLTMTAPDSVVNTPVTFTINLSKGTDYSCTLSYGDATPALALDTTTLLIGIAFTQPHTYTTVDVYTVHIICNNNVSSANVSFDVHIEETISNLRLARLGAPTNEDFRIGWLLGSGSPVTFNVTLNQTVVTFDPSKSNSQHYVWESVLLSGMPAAGYPYTIQAWNHISSANISGLFKIMDKIVNPTFKSNLNNVTTDDNVTFTVDVTKGSDITVVIQFFDGSSDFILPPIPEGVIWPGTLSVNHSFITGCRCPVTATISNAAGAFTLTVSVLVRVGFGAISWTLTSEEQYYLYEPPAIIDFQFISTIKAAPTEPTVEINWGDQTPLIVQNNLTLYSPGYSYVLDDTLDYTINILMYNIVGYRTFAHKAIVVEKLMQPLIEVVFPKAALNVPYTITFKLYRGDQGSLTNITWDFGDGSTPSVTQRQGIGMYGSDNMSVTYTSLGFKTVTITATAPLNQTVSATKVIEVINGIDASAVKVSYTDNVPFGGTSSFTIEYNGIPFPDSPTVTIDYFGDGSSVSSSNSFSSPMTLSDVYIKPGIFNSKVTLQNSASLVEKYVQVGVYQDFVDLKVQVTYPGRPIGANFQDTPGMGSNGQQFPLDAPIKFTLTDNNSALALSYDLISAQNPDNFSINFTSNGFTHKFQMAGNYSLTITAKNPLYSRNVTTSIELVKRVKAMTITEEYKAVEPGFWKNFNISFTDYGQDTCVYIDWGNNLNKSKFGDNLSMCNNSSYNQAVIGGNMQVLVTQLIGMRYLAEGMYTVQFLASNAYGADQQEVSFPISRIKCSKPIVYINLNETLFYEAPKFKRANIIRIRGLASIECPSSLENSKLWTLHEVNFNNGSIISSVNISDLVIDKAELYIPARRLPVGLYKATYSILMINSGPTRFEASAITYFQIIQSGLIALMIEGGMSGITRGSQQMVTLEPLRWSFDPDLTSTQHQGLTVSNWSCEEISSNVQSPCSFAINPTAEFLNISGATLKQNVTYIFKATIVKDVRSATSEINVYMKGTNPPYIIISCLQGSVCYPESKGFTILESSRVSFNCSCPDCSNSALYQWGVSVSDYRWNDGWRPLKDAFIDKYIISSYGLTSKQLSLEKSLLKAVSELERNLRIQCKITDPKGNVSAETYLFINKPPTGGNCSIQPMNATATVTADPLWEIHCSGWRDTDGIKEYQFFSLFDEEEIDREITSYPLSGTTIDEFSINVSLPIGPDYKNFKQTIKVVIRDTLNAATEFIISEVVVLPPDNNQGKQYIAQILEDPTFEFYNIFQAGDQRKVTEMATVFAATLNQMAKDSQTEYLTYEVPSTMICTGYGPYDENRQNAYVQATSGSMDETQYKYDNERDQRSQLRTKLVNFALNTTYEDPIAIQQVAGLIAVAVAEPTEITPDCMDSIMQGISRMIANLNNPTKMADTPQEDIEKAMSKIFSIIGAIMEAAGTNGNYPTLQEMKKTKTTSAWKFYDTSINALGDKNDVESKGSFDEALKAHTKNVYRKAFVEKGIDIENEVEGLMKSMAKLFDSFAIPGQMMNGTSFRMKYRIEKNYIDQFVNKTVTLQNSDAEVLLPNNTADLFPGLSKSEVVTFQVFQSTNVPNRYTERATESIQTYTHFISMSFFGKSGNILQVNNASIPIKITIPHDSNGPRGEKKLISPLVTKWNIFQLHQTETKSPNASIHLQFEIEDGVQLLVVAKYNGIPNPVQNETDFIFVVPQTVPPDPSIKDPYTILITNVMLDGRSGKWWFGTREREAADINTSVPTNQEIVEKYKNGSGEFKYSYNLTLWTSGCYFLSENASDWDSFGCVVSDESTQAKTVCLCNHLTTFAGGFIVVPNTIDWNYVFSHADFLSNPTLYITEMFIAVVFAIAFYLARKKDKKDMTLIGLTPLADNDPRDKYFYEVVVSTGMRRNAGTDSKVYFILSGEEEESDVRLFCDLKRPIFKRGMTNRFLLALPECLGRINYMRVWHDNSGKGKFGSWFLNYIVVKDLQTDTKQVFIANRWFALEEDDGQIDRIIPLAGREQLSDFSYQFGERSKKNLVDGHLWFSVVARPPGSYFTCVERVACCLCLLFMTMLTNAMFYNTENNSSTTASLSISFGPFSLSVSQLFIGFISTVIVFPVNFLLVFLFRKAKPRYLNPSQVGLSVADRRPTTAKLSQVHPQIDQSSSTLSLATTLSYPDGKSDCEKLVGDSTQGSVSLLQQGDPNAASMRTSKKKKSCQLPWWFKIVAWVLLILCTLMSAALVTFYGISFQDDTCKKWITSLIISFFTSVFITQPVKVILTAILLSLIIKNPGEDDEEEEEEHIYPVNTDDDYLHSKKDGTFAAAQPIKVGYKPLNHLELDKMRDIRLKEIKMWAVVREIIFYSVFLWILLVISHNNRGADNFRYKDNMMKTFITNQNLNVTLVKFDDVHSASDLWQWLNNGFITGIMANAYYNDYPPLKLRSYINDKASRILGHAVLRQVRIKKDLCQVPSIMSSALKECNVAYSIGDQEEGDFTAGWIKLNNSNKSILPRAEYMYSSAESLNGYPYWGNLAIYSGGGYIAHLNGTLADLNSTLQKLQDEKWIDKYTRAVFIEFTVYNPQVNLFSVNMLLAEFNLNHGILPSYRFEPAMLLPYMTNAMIFQLVCEVLFVLYIIGFIVMEVIQLMKLRKSYFLMFWNWIEISIISFSLAAIVIYFYRLFETNNLTTKLKATNGNGYIKFQYVGYWNEMFSYLIGFIVFLATIKFLRLLRFNRRISMLADTLKHSGRQLFHFSIIFWIIFFAFAQLFFITFQFGDDQYTTFIQSSISLILMLMGKFSIYSMSMVDPVLSQIYILVYVIWLSFILLNMFVSILTDTFSAVREDVQKQSNDYEIIDFMLGRLKKWTGLGSTAATLDANKSLDGYSNNGYVNEDNKSDKHDNESDQLNSNMNLFPSRIDRLLQSLATIYRENEGASLPWGKQPYQAPPRQQEFPFRPESQARKRRQSMAKVETT